MMSIQLSLIVPTYNERNNILPLAQRVEKALHGLSYEIIVVDDDSPDGTAEMAESLSSKYPIRTICRKGEKGLATAVVAGFAQARGDILGVIDADLQHPPEKLADLLRAIIEDGADVAIGSRYIPGGGVGEWGIIRRAISKGATLVGQLFLPSIRRVKDPMSGFFLLRKEVIEGAELNPLGYKILLEVLVKGNARHVAEVAYTFSERQFGESKLNLGEQLNYLKHIVILSTHEKENRRFPKFALVGASGTIVNLLTLGILVDVLLVSKEISGIVSIEVSMLSNFMLNDLWTFRDRRRGHIIARLGKFHLVSLAGAGITYLVFWLLTDGLAVHYLVSMGVGILGGFVWNFGINNLWTWRKSRTNPTHNDRGDACSNSPRQSQHPCIANEQSLD
ncbi:MAG: glycosyltransferase family 2 protein [Chloroflexota bacterium]|nr:glycosyltransferase family 2 protein [Chloroflexota bacterium]